MNKRAKNFIDLTGKKFGKWTVIKYSFTKNKCPFWKSKCECGVIKTVSSNSFRNNSRSCGCIKKLYSGRKPHKDRDLRIRKDLYARYKCDANKRNIEFDLTLKEFISFIKQECYYCGNDKPSYQFDNKHILFYTGIDRVDNNKGYFIGNCVPCCKSCNSLKRNIPIWMVNKIYELLNDHNSPLEYNGMQL